MVLETPPVASGRRIDSGNLANAPQLNFKVNVSTPGDYTVWVRGMAPDPSGDSVHISVDGSPVGELSGFTMQEWTWAKLDMSGGDVEASLNGLHDLDLHMREDGLRVDKVVLTAPSAPEPVAGGPAESPTGQISTNETQTTIQYTYDDLYRLTDAVYTGDIAASYEYAYDEVGNMQAYTETVDAVVTPHIRVFNAINQMVSETQTNVGTKSISYDTNGNMVRIDPPSGSGAPVKLYTFNQRNLMVKAEELGGSLQTVAEFRYDGNNDRLEQVEFTNGTASNTIQYTNDTIGLTQMLVSNGGAGNVVYHLYGNSHLGQQFDGSSQFQTYITDGLGSVRVEMETSGATNYVRTFSPFGETLDETGTRGSVYGYTGQQEDESTGLIYLRARYYSAELKAFTAYDVWQGINTRPQSMNHYVYTEGNPILHNDVTGLCRGTYLEHHPAFDHCWNYLTTQFCNDVQCENGNDWWSWLEANQIVNIDGSLQDASFDQPWYSNQLKTLAGAVQDVINALRAPGQDINWKNTQLSKVKFILKDQFSEGSQLSSFYSPREQRIYLSPGQLSRNNDNRFVIYHEIGHVFQNEGFAYSQAMRNFVGNISQIIGTHGFTDLSTQFAIATCTVSDDQREDSNIITRPYGTSSMPEAWADAFAVHIIMSRNKGAFPTNAVYPDHIKRQYEPNFPLIDTLVKNLLKSSYGE